MSDSQTEYPTISSVIGRLAEIMKERGDLPIYIFDDEWNKNVPLREITTKDGCRYYGLREGKMVIEEEHVEVW